MKIRFVFISMISVLLLASGWRLDSPALPPDGQEEYFPESGHWIRGEFFKAYHQAWDPRRIYGNPITEAVSLDLSSNSLVQFFEKAIFVLRIDGSARPVIEISPVGKYVYTAGNPRAQIENFTGCRVYAQGGFPVCYAFLEFYESHGGAAQFGLPISGIELQSRTMVQYFERARLEFHPELPQGMKVVVADLGFQYFYLMRLDPQLLKPLVNAAIRGILSLKVRAYPLNAITGAAGRQGVYIIIQDQRSLEVSGARVDITVNLPDGQVLSYAVAQPSNELGMVQFDFNYQSQAIGPAVVNVGVNFEGIKSQTVTSFRIWQ